MYTEPYLLLKVFILALCVYREARGEPFDGMLAVAQTVENRVTDQRWPEEYRDVILQPWQFSAFNKTDMNSFVFPNAKNDEAWEKSVLAAFRVLNEKADFASGANHYLAAKIPEDDRPSWADPGREVCRIGGHIFYRL